MRHHWKMYHLTCYKNATVIRITIKFYLNVKERVFLWIIQYWSIWWLTLRFKVVYTIYLVATLYYTYVKKKYIQFYPLFEFNLYTSFDVHKRHHWQMNNRILWRNVILVNDKKKQTWKYVLTPEMLLKFVYNSIPPA